MSLRILSLILIASNLCFEAAAAEPPAPLPPLPSKSQLAWQQNERSLLIYFGMNTFTGRDIGLGTEDPRFFNPTNLDCRQWARVARDTGFAGLILTAKHYDGFCLWPTATTDRSVRQSAWRGGRGDVVRELAEACREFGLKFGLYCSPWDRSQPIYDSDRPAYARFYQQQLTELLSNYGPVYEMWFDGNRANIPDWPGIIQLVRRLQPDAVIKQGPRLTQILEDVRWVGNEQANAPLANWSVFPPPQSNATQRIWFPVECNTPMVGNLFWDGTPPRSLATLLNYYYTSVGRNSTLLLSAAPDKNGQFSTGTVQRLTEFNDALRQIFGTDLAFGKNASANNVRGNHPDFSAEKVLGDNPGTYWTVDDGQASPTIEIDLGEETEFNVIRLDEMISLGQRVGEYRLDAWDSNRAAWIPVSQGFTIGYRKLDRFPNVRSSKVRLTILNSRAAPAISRVGIHLDRISSPP